MSYSFSQQFISKDGTNDTNVTEESKKGKMVQKRRSKQELNFNFLLDQVAKSSQKEKNAMLEELSLDQDQWRCKSCNYINTVENWKDDLQS